MAQRASVSVFVRVRPLREGEERGALEIEGERTVVVARNRQFPFSGVFPETAGQEDVYSGLGQHVVASALSGFNACVLAYGQTGSGKTHTMVGKGGVVPSVGSEVFRLIGEAEGGQGGEAEGGQGDEYEVTASFLEIYNEKVADLLAPSSSSSSPSKPLRVTGEGVVDGLTEVIVRDAAALADLLEFGAQWRTVAATALNKESSRSHAVVSLNITHKKAETKTEVRSRIHFADLAGSERVKASGAADNSVRFGEACNINRSLTALGIVIDRLARRDAGGEGREHIPYRDSVLTRLLQDALGGNSRTFMLATVSPAAADADQTLSTLRYASIASSIVNTVAVNEAPWAQQVRDLKRRVAELEGALRKTSEPVLLRDPQLLAELEDLRARVAARVSDDQAQQRREGRRVSQVMREGREALQQLGIAPSVSLDPTPGSRALVNVAADPSLSGTLRYPLLPGLTVVTSSVGEEGSDSDDSQASSEGEEEGEPHRIILQGSAIHSDHCRFRVRGETCAIQARRGADTFVNGQITRGKRQLATGDRVVLGFTHAFVVVEGAEGAEGGQLSWRSLLAEVVSDNRGMFGIQPGEGQVEEESAEEAVLMVDRVCAANELCLALQLPCTFQLRRSKPRSKTPPVAEVLAQIGGSPSPHPPASPFATAPPMSLLQAALPSPPATPTTPVAEAEGEGEGEGDEFVLVTSGAQQARWDAATFDSAFFALQALQAPLQPHGHTLFGLTSVFLLPVANLVEMRTHAAVTDARGLRVAHLEVTVSWEVAGAASAAVGGAPVLEQLCGRDIAVRIHLGRFRWASGVDHEGSHYLKLWLPDPDTGPRLLDGTVVASECFSLGARGDKDVNFTAEVRGRISDSFIAFLRRESVTVQLWTGAGAQHPTLSLPSAPAELQTQELACWIDVLVCAAAARQAVLGAGRPPAVCTPTPRVSGKFFGTPPPSEAEGEGEAVVESGGLLFDALEAENQALLQRVQALTLENEELRLAPPPPEVARRSRVCIVQ